MKDIGVKLSKRKPINSILSLDDVLNDINDRLAEENVEKDETSDNLDELCGEEEETVSNPNEECLEEKHQFEESEDTVNRQRRCGPRKKLTPNQNVHDIYSSLDENNYK